MNIFALVLFLRGARIEVKLVAPRTDNINFLITGDVAGLLTAAQHAAKILEGLTQVAIGVGAAFESQMTRVKIIAGATDTEFEELTAKAKEMGARLPIDARAAGQAMELMAQRGTQAKDILASVEDVANLAISQGSSMAASADLLGSALLNFGLGIEEAANVVDIFNNASNQSALSMGSLHYSLQYVSSAAAAAGYNLEQTVAALGLLADSGMGGSMSGTALTGVLSTMAEKSEILGVRTKNLDGTLRPLSDVFLQLKTRGMSLGEATDVFGQRASKAAMNFAKYADTLESREKNLKQLGATQKAVNDQLGTFDNVWKKFQSAQESANLSWWDQIKDTAKDFVNGMAEMVLALNDWIKETNIAARATKAFLEGFGLSLPSRDEFKAFLDSIDVDTIVAKANDIGQAIRNMVDSLRAIGNIIAGPIALFAQHIEWFMQLEFWEWIINRGNQLRLEFIDIVDGFTWLATAIGQVVSTLAAVLANPVVLFAGAVGGIAALIYGTWRNVTGRNREAIEAAEQDLNMWERLVNTEDAVAELANLQTGFEETSEKAKNFTDIVKDFYDRQVARKKAPFLEALEEYNKSLGENEADLKVFEDQLETFGKNGMLAKALNGDAEALEAIGPIMRRFLTFLKEYQEFGKKEYKSPFDNDKNRKIFTETISEADRAQAALETIFEGGVTKSFKTAVDELPAQFRRMQLLAKKAGIVIRPEVSLEHAKKKIDEVIKNEIKKDPTLSEEVLRQGVASTLRQYTGEHEALIYALADMFDSIAAKTKTFGQDLQDAMEYLNVDPNKMAGMIEPLLKNVQKIDPVTGKITSEFKEWKKILDDVNKKKFSNIQSLAEDFRNMREKGNISEKEYTTQVKAMLGTFLRETYKQFEGDRVNYNTATGPGLQAWDANVMTKLGDAVVGAFGKELIPAFNKVWKDFQRAGGGSGSRGLDETEKRGILTLFERQAALEKTRSATGRFARESPGAPINPLAVTKADQVEPMAEMAKAVQELTTAMKAQAKERPQITPDIVQGQTEATTALTEQLRNTVTAIVGLPEIFRTAIAESAQSVFSEGKSTAPWQTSGVTIDVTQNITLKEDMKDVGAWADAFKRAIGMAGLTPGIGNAAS
jgi:TP901 family phage tail tape measure protein